MASSSKKYTRSNLDPDPKSPIEDPKTILKNKKQKDQSALPIFQRSNSLATYAVKTLHGLKFDLKFQHSLFRSKSDSDLKEVVIDIPGLNTFIPKSFFVFSKRKKYIFWDLLTEEIKRKLESLEQHRDYSPLDFLLKREIRKFSKDGQSVNYTVYTARPSGQGHSKKGQSSQVLSTTSQPLYTMANRYALCFTYKFECHASRLQFKNQTVWGIQGLYCQTTCSMV